MGERRKLQYGEIATWLAWHGDMNTTPEARLVSQHILSYFQPDRACYLYVPNEMLQQSLGWEELWVENALADLLSPESFIAFNQDSASVLWGTYTLTEQGIASRDAWIDGNRLGNYPQENRWRNGLNAVMKFELRYSPWRGQSTWADLLALMLASFHGIDRSLPRAWKLSMLAESLGTSKQVVISILPFLRERGWTMTLDGEQVTSSPSASLLAEWKKLAEALLKQTRRDGKRISGGEAESEYAKENWDFSYENGSGAVEVTDAIEGSLDFLPENGSWQVYRIASVLDQEEYIGITSRSLRSRGFEHLTRKGQVKEREHNQRMADMYKRHADLDREPIIELLEIVPYGEKQAERVEHRYVNERCEVLGKQAVLNKVHHPDFPSAWCRH